MRTVTLPPHLEEVSRDAEKSLREFLEQIYQRTRNSVNASFSEWRMLLHEQEERNQLDAIERELHKRVVELWHIYAFSQLNWASIFEFSDYLEDDYGIFSFDDLDKNWQSFIILLAFYCAYKYWEVDWRNWTWNGKDLAHYVPDDLNPVDYKWLIENGLQVNSIIDIASEKFLERKKRSEIERLWNKFLEFATSDIPCNRIWWIDLEFLDIADLQINSKYMNGRLSAKLIALWDIFVRDCINRDE